MLVNVNSYLLHHGLEARIVAQILDVRVTKNTL